ncbi:hypothetical protein J6590_036310 [Homalodisca vitripennis]|nr:hypothetical protein J6590_036310 [Homalodisca vitripennis]
MNIHIQKVNNLNRQPLSVQTQTCFKVITCCRAASLILSVLRKSSIMFSFWLELTKMRPVFVILYVECLSEQEHIMILMMQCYGDQVISYDEVMNIFNDTYLNQEFKKESNIFQETGSVKDCPKPGHPKLATNEALLLDILQSVVEDPHASTRNVSQILDISQTSVCKFYKTVVIKLYNSFSS